MMVTAGNRRGQWINLRQVVMGWIYVGGRRRM